MGDGKTIDQRFKELSASTGIPVDQLKAMTWEDLEQLKRQTMEEMMETERDLFALKSAFNASAKSTGAKEVTVPAFIVLEWDEEGEPQVYAPIEKCTRDQILGHVGMLRRQVMELENEIANLTRYVDGGLEFVRSGNNDPDKP